MSFWRGGSVRDVPRIRVGLLKMLGFLVAVFVVSVAFHILEGGFRALKRPKRPGLGSSPGCRGGDLDERARHSCRPVDALRPDRHR